MIQYRFACSVLIVSRLPEFYIYIFSNVLIFLLFFLKKDLNSEADEQANLATELPGKFPNQLCYCASLLPSSKPSL